uniref:Carboxylesterase type B domain-containing protein n=1 Tax=Romanomermis culicivorax TaxID=13658 RepID=A0A915L9C0_ROMCU
MIAGKYRLNSAFSFIYSFSAYYFLSIIIYTDGINSQNLIVATDVGRFQGRIARSANNLSVAVFVSVPYAQSPGQLPGTQRFSKTEALQMSEDLFDSTLVKPPCARFNIIDGVSFDQTSSEDCFYLTVLTPSLSNITCCSPVLFWIPDDGFSDGTTTNELDHEILIDNFVTKNIVIVLANFR